MIVRQASRAGVHKLSLITYGNAGFSLAKFAEEWGIEVAVIIDKKLGNKEKRRLREVCARVIEKDLTTHVLTPEEIVALGGGEGWDVTNGFHQAYEEIYAVDALC